MTWEILHLKLDSKLCATFNGINTCLYNNICKLQTENIKKKKKCFFQIFKIDSGIYLILLSDHLIAFDIEGARQYNTDLTDDGQRLVVASTEIFENRTIKPSKVPAGKIQNTTDGRYVPRMRIPSASAAASLTVLPRKTPGHNCGIRVPPSPRPSCMSTENGIKC